MNRATGEVLTGWPAVEQSIGVILTTPIGSRVMRREFGSELLDIIDRPMTDSVVLALYVATVVAIIRWEPRFEVTGVDLAEPSASGAVTIRLRGVYDGAFQNAEVRLT